MAVYDKLGRPLNSADYTMPEGEGVDEGFVGWARDAFHAAGLPQDMATKVTEAYQEMTGARQQETVDAYNAGIAQAEQNLAKDWGAALEQNTNIAKMAAKTHGATPEMIDAMEQAIGMDGTMKFFHGIGAKMGEGEFITGGGAEPNILTPEAARAQITALERDKEFVAKYTTGDAAAVTKMKRLHEMAIAG